MFFNNQLFGGWRNKNNHDKFEKQGFDYFKLIGGTSEDGSHASFGVVLAIKKQYVRQKVIYILVNPFNPKIRFNPQTPAKKRSSKSGPLETLEKKFEEQNLAVVKSVRFWVDSEKEGHEKFFFLVFESCFLAPQTDDSGDPQKQPSIYVPVLYAYERLYKVHKTALLKCFSFLSIQKDCPPEIKKTYSKLLQASAQ